MTEAKMTPDHFSLAAYEYDLPSELIAQEPCYRRDRSRLLVLDRSSAKVHHHFFMDLPDLLSESDILVLNETHVVPASLTGRKISGGVVELLVLDPLSGPHETSDPGITVRECLVKASKPLKQGTTIVLSDAAELTVLGSASPGRVLIAFPSRGTEFLDFLNQHGQTPLPPYIRKKNRVEDRDRERYQTVYSRVPGSVAAPTAGLHFSRELLSQLQRRGVSITRLVLHVGSGTFLPVRHKDIRKHEMEPERYDIPPETAELLNTALKDKRRVIAVGTTTLRALESAVTRDGSLRSGPNATDLFIFPGYQFRIVRGLVTNFHLPASTLLMLVCAFARRGMVMDAYRQAMDRQYRWYSYGDACLII